MKRQLKPSEREAFRLIEEMLALMESRDLVELEIETQGLRIKLRKASPGTGQVVEYANLPQPTQQPTSEAAAAVEQANRIVIPSPMVGTFYRAPAPDAPPFIEVGHDVEIGQVVCIIEAMKLMNEIKSEVAGRVVEVLAQSGEPVEFSQPLFALEPRP